MKIAQVDKVAIVNKITLTLVKALQAKLEDPRKLLIEVYCAWFDAEIKGQKNTNLYKLIPKAKHLSLKIRPQTIESFNSFSHTSSMRETLQISPVTTLQDTDIPQQYDLLICSSERYSQLTTIDTTPFPAIHARIEQYHKVLQEERTKIKDEMDKLTAALNTLNTYKQLETRLPVIFNSMPDSCKEKYNNYLSKARTKRTQKKDKPEVDNFSNLGVTLAVESLKEGSK